VVIAQIESTGKPISSGLSEAANSMPDTLVDDDLRSETTARRDVRTQAAVLTSEQRYRHLFEHVPIASSLLI
jgi:hypothetical protein